MSRRSLKKVTFYVQQQTNLGCGNYHKRTSFPLTKLQSLLLTDGGSVNLLTQMIPTIYKRTNTGKI